MIKYFKNIISKIKSKLPKICKCNCDCPCHK